MRKRAILTAVLLVLIVGGAWFGYRKLSDKFRPDTQLETLDAGTKETAAPETVMVSTAPADEGPEGDAEADTVPAVTEDDGPEGDAEASAEPVDEGPEGDADASVIPADEGPEGDADAAPVAADDTSADNASADNASADDASADSASEGDASEGEAEVYMAPDFTALDCEGNEVHLSDLVGKPILINFWATWCPPCRQELPYFEAAYKEYGDDIIFMMVDLADGSTETEEVVRAFVEENGYTFPVYYDKDYSATYAYGLNSIPRTFAIGRNGNLLGYQIGAMSESGVDAAIQLLLNE